MKCRDGFQGFAGSVVYEHLKQNKFYNLTQLFQAIQNLLPVRLVYYRFSLKRWVPTQIGYLFGYLVKLLYNKFI